MTIQSLNPRVFSKVKALMVGFSALVICFLISIVFAEMASAHGYIEGPNSRSYMCKLGENTNCGSVQYEPQSIETTGNFPTNGPADGQIAGGGIFKELDEQTSDRWKKVTLQTGLNTFTWKLTAAHATENWKYYITKADWDPNQPLGRDDIELFCEFYDEGARPDFTTSHECNIPTDRTGYHLILGVWDIWDTPMAFYQVIDANIVSSGATQGPSVPANVSAASKTDTSISLKWTASTATTGIANYEIYRNGNLVGTTTTNSYVDQGLTANTAYAYTVRAVDGSGAKSQASPVVTITTAAENGGNNGGTNPEWSSTAVYLVGAKVQYNGATYQAKWWTQNETPGQSAVWQLVSESSGGESGGGEGSQLPEWVSTKVYVGGDKVQYNGVSYEAKWWTQNENPSNAAVWKKI
ncbi:MAG: lytic polysaccharide monooxygenase [Candidatus Pristimantibacillus lignocellulolyticus]|uniref:Lytic polysaccharide monooxygenase n=1 Tax=Candidatus Pristimantibacillus lignocellulolyticus TaxID=2994561 RepID=A0A9J6ZD14_9BACL|nr:MAG: lytic polysaccharide monooxygenase [Candidatus Pristimantibacillus lignocellulolyticus]